MNEKTAKYLRFLAKHAILGSEVAAKELSTYPDRAVRRALNLAERKLRRQGK